MSDPTRGAIIQLAEGSSTGLLASDPPPEVPMFGLGKKAFAGRIGRAVDASLEPGEEVAVSLWTRDPNGDLSRAIFGLLVEAGVASFILTLTDRRVIVHQGNNSNASKSTLLGSYPRQEVSVLRADPSAKPTHLDVRFGHDKDARFTVQALWAREAKAFADGLDGPS